MADNGHSSFLTAQRWAEIVIERWQKKITQFDLIDTGSLLHSFNAAVTADAQGNPAKVTFTFLYYGRFADMGAGGFRERKPWYSSVFLKEVVKLGYMLAAKYGYDAAQLSAFNTYIFI
jgi:hypothetical protein